MFSQKFTKHILPHENSIR